MKAKMSIFQQQKPLCWLEQLHLESRFEFFLISVNEEELSCKQKPVTWKQMAAFANKF